MNQTIYAFHQAQLKIQGPDAKDFLHRVTSADVKNLQRSEKTAGCILQATGKIIAVFNITYLEPESYLVESPLTADELFKAFDKFHFGEKLKITAEKLSPHEISITEQKNRIEQKIPLWSQEITTDLNPLECGLDFAAAENKGCYPGQEVIEKIRSYAQPAKKLVKVKGTGPTPTLPSYLLQSHDKSECGKLTSAIGDGTNWTGLAIIRRSSLSQNQSFQVGDTHVTVLES